MAEGKHIKLGWQTNPYQQNEVEGYPIFIESYHRLTLTDEEGYFVNPEYTDFPEDAPKSPTVYLLQVIIDAHNTGLSEYVLYFIYENINFLNVFLLRHHISISHFVKVREGLGFGGNRKSISIDYAFLSCLNTKYLIVDKEEQTDFELIHEIAENNHLIPNDYHLTLLQRIINWSNFNVNIFKVEQNDNVLNDERLAQLLEIITFNHEDLMNIY